ncbi:hypothetical protein ABT112_05280 [Streptomyces sp. NPDC002055]|uniref:hypothetical protein n=1 Tax=Streptomyces sp. NPDC002055 TaxID=3154534 RepID=UPI00333112B5
MTDRKAAASADVVIPEAPGAEDGPGQPIPDTVRKLEPVPVQGCDVCESCGREREEARRAGRSLEVRSLNGVIAGHPHGREVRA